MVCNILRIWIDSGEINCAKVECLENLLLCFNQQMLLGLKTIATYRGALC